MTALIVMLPLIVVEISLQLHQAILVLGLIVEHLYFHLHHLPMKRPCNRMLVVAKDIL
jgi:hypothetical protein